MTRFAARCYHRTAPTSAFIHERARRTPQCCLRSRGLRCGGSHAPPDALYRICMRHLTSSHGLAHLLSRLNRGGGSHRPHMGCAVGSIKRRTPTSRRSCRLVSVGLVSLWPNANNATTSAAARHSAATLTRPYLRTLPLTAHNRLPQRSTDSASRRCRPRRYGGTFCISLHRGAQPTQPRCRRTRVAHDGSVPPLPDRVDPPPPLCHNTYGLCVAIVTRLRSL